MNTSWTSCTIQDLQNKGEAELKTGPFGTQLHASDYVETGTPVINVRNIGFGEIREEKLEFIAEETVQRLSLIF
jgi:type I restriction enzyme S subunit